jgi:hypothetical protein
MTRHGVMLALLTACGAPDDGAVDTDAGPGAQPVWSGELDPGPATVRRLTRPELEHACATCWASSPCCRPSSSPICRSTASWR